MEAKDAVLYFVKTFRWTFEQLNIFIFFNRLQYVFQGRNPILLLSMQSGVRLRDCAIIIRRVGGGGWGWKTKGGGGIT